VVSGTAHQALFAVAFDGDAGIAVGAGGQMLASQDGGKSWQAVAPSPTDKALLGVAIGPGRALVVGQSGVILMRDATGAWQAVASGTEERLFAVDVNAGGVAVAVGAFGKILRSADGGVSWSSVAPSWTEGYTDQGLEPHLYDVKVGPDGVITCVGEFGLILRSTDGGLGWAVLHKGDASLFALDLRGDGVGYAVGQGGAILRTTDGGATWVDVPSGSTANLLGVRSAADGRVLVSAMRDMLASDDGLAWRRVDWGDFGSAWYSGVSLSGNGAVPTALVVGHSGRIVRIGR
jgi:photosystem II stability/assembly factor-like uncharacterized protein